ncbi:MAG: ABC transporter ATP-binding protein, partial [Pseudomonadales bacterium]|nr:ABC transporter ATP-binding protein [Pseudomonadales bacterium]
TNWLDNKSQAQVMRSIAEIAATRVVVAHRLSTIKNADRIYVLSQGRVVQSGTFDELAVAPGMFQDLMARQVT